MNSASNDKTLPAWLEFAWLEQYLSSSLSDDEMEWFEVYMLDKPHLIAEIEADTDLRDGLLLSKEDLSLSNAFSENTVVKQLPVGSDQRRWLPMAWAASLFAALSVGWVISAFNSDDQIDLISSPTRMVFDTMRGIDSQPLIHPGDPESQYLLIEVGMPPDAEQIQLHIAGEPTQSLILSPDSFVSFLLSRERLSDSTPPRIEYVSAGKERERELPVLAE